ncbi:MAG: PilZ domain-containing protein [Spirochaetaceae bacterium]|nr:PilZ domain-containing protein [Spirochaetaceae bacterium]
MEKRRIERHLLEEHVHIDGGANLIPGRTIDVSRNGMRVVVNRPDGFDTLHRVSVNIPGAVGEGIPCRVKRSEREAGHWVIGLEFDGNTDARMLLVERWLESLENRPNGTESAPTESRQVPRTRCRIRDIRCTTGGLEVVSVDDISLEGMLIRAYGQTESGKRVGFTMILPGENREISFDAIVAYTIDNGPDQPIDVGLSMDTMKETDRNRLRAYIVDIASGAAMKEYHRYLKQEEPSEEFRISGDKVFLFISQMAEDKRTVNILDDIAFRILESHIEDSDDSTFRVPIPHWDSDTAFFSFTSNGASFSFSTERIDWIDGFGLFQIPDIIYRGEKRAGRRRNTDGMVKIDFSAPAGPVTGKILDSSRRGVLCEIPKEAFTAGIPKEGEALDLSMEGRTTPGEIRHIVEVADSLGRKMYRIGVETGISRIPAHRIVYKSDQWREIWNGPSNALGEMALVRPRVVEYTERSGRKITGLLHLNGTDKPCTAVVIPPAFGKKKEALAPLALTLMSHFTAAGENVAILRYDGVDKPGESENTNSHARRGYEMLGYRIEQGYADLEASMQWVKKNTEFQADQIVLISFSMAALDARRLQSTLSAPRADYWISVMGVSSAQGALRNILGGLDVVANHRMGLPVGTMGMLGQLIDMDRMAADMIRLGYATVADAREAMSRVESPVTWIYGVHDKWMIPEEIRDIMSIAAPGKRELIEIPTAHNLRTSDDAIASFQLISDAILRQIRSKVVPPVSPDKEELLDLLTRERERVIEGETLDPKRYWKGYLVGETQGEEGYDFYLRLAEFREFLSMEATLVDPKPGESIADMGCGTGLVSEAILSRLAEGDKNLTGSRFTAVDLVDEALAKAATKFRRLKRSHPNLELVDDAWVAMDLEPDPLAAIRQTTSRPKSGIEFLRDRVKGLRSDIIDRLALISPEIITRVLSGERLSLEKYDSISPADILVLEDLNRAARFILGDLEEEDLKPNRRIGTGPVGPERTRNLRTSDLITAMLDLGDWDNSGRLPLPDEEFDAVCASLFLSYLFAPEEAVKEFARMLKPGGRLLISSMKPDSDISGIFTRYIAEQTTMNRSSSQDEEREKNLREARAMLNEAASLFSLEEDGWFRFFDANELISMMRIAGFSRIKVYESLGEPAQAVIVTGIKKKV